MSMPSPAQLTHVLTGQAVPYTRPGSLSAIAKHPRYEPVLVTRLGLEGDAQGDRRVHGGPDKALHHYPSDHYGFWRLHLDGPLLNGPGAFGENLSAAGWIEADIHIGDVVQAGSVTLEVSQARQPCWKLNDRFNTPDVARLMQSSGRTGWYYRVLEEGTIQAGDTMTVVRRPYPDWPLARLMRLLFDRSLDRHELLEALALPLPASWTKLLERRLERNEIESWDARLNGPATFEESAS